MIYHCQKCGNPKDGDSKIVWLTSSYGVCFDCYFKHEHEWKNMAHTE